MQPLGNIGLEPAETSRKSKSSKTAITSENVAKSTKAQDVLAKRKADAAKAALPPLAEKSTKLLKVNETLARRKAEAAKVAAAEREKKKFTTPPLLLMSRSG
jgi:acyl-CoA reductase-like NAD-dependent aldehyde dehydrogenase